MVLSADILVRKQSWSSETPELVEGVPDRFAQLVLCSPPYPNNYDYADATRLEMSFFREISGWGDLQHTVRDGLIRSCSQHVPEKAVDLEEVLSRPEVEPIRRRTGSRSAGNWARCGCRAAERRLTISWWRVTSWTLPTSGDRCGGFAIRLAARVSSWAIRRPTASTCRSWNGLGTLAVAAGFRSFAFEQTRDRNVKWKNRKHRVPLCEGRLWVEG